ncbi:MAG TPA: zinc ribbon domain-containing protein [Spirochaetia bacterium]|nr:zinc ribbon domain-containing protein [Spirochaetia bacterium]
MPTYEYHCKECGTTFDQFMDIDEKKRRQEAHEITCEQCGSDTLEQVFGGFSVFSGAAVGSSEAGGSCCAGGGGSCCS